MFFFKGRICVRIRVLSSVGSGFSRRKDPNPIFFFSMHYIQCYNFNQDNWSQHKFSCFSCFNNIELKVKILLKTIFKVKHIKNKKFKFPERLDPRQVSINPDPNLLSIMSGIAFPRSPSPYLRSGSLYKKKRINTFWTYSVSWWQFSLGTYPQSVN